MYSVLLSTEICASLVLLEAAKVNKHWFSLPVFDISVTDIGLFICCHLSLTTPFPGNYCSCFTTEEFSLQGIKISLENFITELRFEPMSMEPWKPTFKKINSQNQLPLWVLCLLHLLNIDLPKKMSLSHPIIAYETFCLHGNEEVFSECHTFKTIYSSSLEW